MNVRHKGLLDFGDQLAIALLSNWLEPNMSEKTIENLTLRAFEHAATATMALVSVLAKEPKNDPR